MMFNVFQLGCLNPNSGSWKSFVILLASCLGTLFARTKFWSGDLQLSLSKPAFGFVCTAANRALGHSWARLAVTALGSFLLNLTCGAHFTNLPSDSS